MHLNLRRCLGYHVAGGMHERASTCAVNGASVVKTSAALSETQPPIPKSLLKFARFLVEMGGLEPPTPYMRSKCSTS